MTNAGKSFAVALVALVGVAGCATKQYPATRYLSQTDAVAMSCTDLQVDLARSEQTLATIRDTARTDWRSVAGFAIDFGVGNHMARSEADTAVSQRIAAIKIAQAEKSCSPAP